VNLARGGAGAALAGALILSLMPGPGRSAPGAQDDMVLGNPAAPVTVIEYASVGCPHCGDWARVVFPVFKTKYVDTGMVRFVFREVLFGDAAVAAAGFLTARCAGRAHYFQVVEGIFEAQPEMEREGSDLPQLTRIAREAGLTQAQFAACLADHAALAALEARSDGYTERDRITGTPTFVIGSQRLVGFQELPRLEAAIASAEAEARAAARPH